MKIDQRIERVPTWAWVLLFSVVICLPRLGAFGFWDPWELKVADQAREMAKSGNLFDVTIGGKQPNGPVLALALQALGIGLIGVSELGARFFIALTAIGALLAVYWAGLGLLRRRAALLATLAMGSMTMFVLEARQLTSDMPTIAGLALGAGGLGRWAWPGDGKRRAQHLGVGLVGLAIASLGSGILLGVVLPVAALLAAVLVGYGLGPPPAGETADPLAAPGDGPDVPAGGTIGRTLLHPAGKAFPIFLVLCVVGGLLLVLSVTGQTVGKYSVLLGGAPRGGPSEKMFEHLIEQLGFGLFPWGALAVFALARPLVRLDDEAARTAGRLAFQQLFLLFFAAFGFALGSLLVIMVGEARFVAFAPIALAIGALLDEVLEGRRPEPVLGLVVATGTMVVGRDFFLSPEEMVSTPLGATVKWPPSIQVGNGVLLLALLVGGGTFCGFALRGRAVGTSPRPDLAGAPGWRRALATLLDQAGRWGVHAAVGGAICFALFVAQYLQPHLSRHYSFKNVLGDNSCVKDGSELGKYRVEGKGAGFYARDMSDIPNQDSLMKFLKKQSRACALINAEELPNLDATLKTAQVAYVVIDASSSRFLMISNKLAPGEQDKNPLKDNVRPDPFPPPRVTASGVFDGKIELIGADYPTEIKRPDKIPLKLYFKVLARIPGSYQIFVHFDSPGTPRLNGDHHPLNKAFPTTAWLPGYYVRDDYDVDVPLMTTPAGTYTVLMGFWPGGEGRRLKATVNGEPVSDDRVRVGTIEIK